MNKNKKFIWIGIAMIVIGGFVMFNVGLNSQNEFYTIYNANMEALSSEGESSVRCKSDSKDVCTLSSGDEIEDYDERD